MSHHETPPERDYPDCSNFQIPSQGTLPDLMRGSDDLPSIEGLPLENQTPDAYSRVLTLWGVEGGVSVAGARPGLQNRGNEGDAAVASPKPAKRLRQSRPHRGSPIDPPVIHDTCQTDPDLVLVQAAWDRLPAAVKAGLVAMVRAAAT